MLRLTSPMMHGPAVVRLQETCDLFGFDTGPNDGIFGKDTDQALRSLQAFLGLSVDGVYGPVTRRAVAVALSSSWPVDTGKRSAVVDISGKHAKPKGYAHSRALSRITGITLHQTGCDMPNTPMGWQRVNAHYGIMRDGTAIRINDISSMIWHAQRLSPFTVGIEIEGNYCGVEGDLRTLWRGGGGPHSLTPEMVEAAALVLSDIEACLSVSVSRAPALTLYAHRQSSPTRRGDPGGEIWRRIAQPWIDSGAVLVAPDFKFGNGRALPRQWDADYKAGF